MVGQIGVDETIRLNYDAALCSITWSHNALTEGDAHGFTSERLSDSISAQSHVSSSFCSPIHLFKTVPVLSRKFLVGWLVLSFRVFSTVPHSEFGLQLHNESRLAKQQEKVKLERS